MRISQGNYFPKAAVIGGVILIAFGILGSLENAYASIPFLLIGIYLSFTYGGIEIDNTKKRFRDYALYFGIPIGSKWKDLDKYPDLCVLKTRESSTTYSRTNNSVSYKESYYDVFMLTNNHRAKIFLKRFDTKEEAFKKARELESILTKELKVYNPKGSAKSAK